MDTTYFSSCLSGLSFGLNFFPIYINDLSNGLKTNAKLLADDKKCPIKKLFLEISQNSKENTCVRVSFLIKLQASGLRTPFLTEHLQWLLLYCQRLK